MHTAVSSACLLRNLDQWFRTPAPGSRSLCLKLEAPQCLTWRELLASLNVRFLIFSYLCVYVSGYLIYALTSVFLSVACICLCSSRPSIIYPPFLSLSRSFLCVCRVIAHRSSTSLFSLCLSHFCASVVSTHHQSTGHLRIIYIYPYLTGRHHDYTSHVMQSDSNSAWTIGNVFKKLAFTVQQHP